MEIVEPNVPGVKEASYLLNLACRDVTLGTTPADRSSQKGLVALTQRTKKPGVAPLFLACLGHFQANRGQ